MSKIYNPPEGLLMSYSIPAKHICEGGLGWWEDKSLFFASDNFEFKEDIKNTITLIGNNTITLQSQL